jgi:uncharacterized phage-like protein YoqJ
MRIAITGHRPDKLGGYDANNPLRVHLRNRFKGVLLCLVADAGYRNMLTYAKRVEYVSKVDPPLAYGDGSEVAAMMYERNRYMVDSCDIIVAAWDGSRGGTGHCVEYARHKKKEIIVLTPGRVCHYGPDDTGIQGDKMYYINPQPVSNAL